MLNSLICHSLLLQVFCLTDEDHVAEVDQGSVF